MATKSSATDPVSDADHAAEARIVAFLRAARPHDGIVAEEGSGGAGTTGVRWVVDPLDGTVNYLYGIPQWSVSIAALAPDGALAGVVYDPVRDELFAASRGGGAHLGERPIAASDLTEVSRALLATGYSYVADERREQARREARLIASIRDVRRFGSAALDLAWVACGRVDGYCESVGAVWDWAAGSLLVREAGGLVTEVPGVRRDAPGIVASGAGIHASLVALVREGAVRNALD